MADAFADVLELIVRDNAISDAQKDVDLNATADEPAAVIAANKQQIVTEAAERRAGSTSIQFVDVEDVPLAYLAGNATRIRVKAVGDLRHMTSA